MNAPQHAPAFTLLPEQPPHLPSAPTQGWAHCHCCTGLARPQRRHFSALLGLGAASAICPALAEPGSQEGVNVGKQSALTRLVPAEQLEAAAAQQYRTMLQEAAQQRALAPAGEPQLQRLRYIAERIIPVALPWNPRAKQWRWEVNLLGSPQLNAFCMPGGKIAFYSGILVKLQLSDDEVATIMGHEVAHALREHARERMAKTTATRVGANVISGLLGLGSLGDTLLSYGSQLLTLTFSREDESEADLVGLELSARAGYDPAAGVSLWKKMGAVNKGAPPQWLSTHPSGPSRIKDIEANLGKVQGLYERADKPQRRWGPPEAKR
ncbi:M48 family metallopeptidase [Roseateles sp. BYS180W]|uniref:M48 family metallopeptidase n=1 Tax=Roseateles rivi TaxID=3299028 RepID=A0ABW7FTJ9_9BURK